MPFFHGSFYMLLWLKGKFFKYFVLTIVAFGFFSSYSVVLCFVWFWYIAGLKSGIRG